MGKRRCLSIAPVREVGVASHRISAILSEAVPRGIEIARDLKRMLALLFLLLSQFQISPKV
jgi:hypothetical protein